MLQRRGQLYIHFVLGIPYLYEDWLAEITDEELSFTSFDSKEDLLDFYIDRGLYILQED